MSSELPRGGGGRGGGRLGDGGAESSSAAQNPLIPGGVLELSWLCKCVSEQGLRTPYQPDLDAAKPARSLTLGEAAPLF